MLTAHHSMWIFGLKFYIFIIRLKNYLEVRKAWTGFQAFYVWVIVIEICLFSSLSQTR